MTNRREWLDKATAALQNTEAPRRSAELLLCDALGMERIELITRPDHPLPAEAEIALASLLARRQAGEPVAYLLGKREFYGRDFAVGPATLIPRPETEHLVDEALARLPDDGIAFVDLGSGSGCLAVTLAAEKPAWRGVAVDVSEAALAVARRNAESQGVADRIVFVRADFTASGFWRDFLPDAAPRVDLVVSNPPYISEAEYASLDSGVRDYEPVLALVPGPTGLEHPAAVADAAWSMLRPGGLLLMEHGASQGPAVRALCCAERWSGVATGRDLAGLERYLVATRRQNNFKVKLL